MGIVYYSRYFEFFEAARTELLRTIGLNVPELESRGYFLPVITSHCDYQSPAHFDDIVVVETIIKDLPKLRLRIEYQARSDDGGKLFASGYTEHCFTNQTGKPVRIPSYFLNQLKLNYNE